MTNPFDKFDKFDTTKQKPNPFDQFNGTQQLLPIERLLPIDRSSGGFIETAMEDPVYDPRKTIANLPGGAIEYGKNLLEFLRSPKESAETLGSIGAGGVQAAFASDKKTPEREQFDRFVQAYSDKYGSAEQVLKTLEEKPIEMASDMAALLVGSGGLMKGAGDVSKLRQLSDIGTDLAKTGASVEPLTASMGLISKGVRAAIPKEYPVKAYQSAVKFNTTLTTPEYDAVTKTALNAEIMPTIKGLDKLQSLIDNLDAEIASTIEGGVRAGEKIPTAKLFKHFGKVEVEALGELLHKDAAAAIQKVRDNLMDKIRRGKTEMTPQEVQYLKKSTYKRLRTAYASNKYDPASVRAQKAVARAAKDSLEDIFPEIKEMNKQDGEYIALIKAIETKAKRITNRDLIGIGLPIKGTMGGVIGDTPGAIVGIIAGVFDTPQVKAKLAIVANKMKKKGIRINPTSAAIRLGLVTLGRQTSEERTRLDTMNVGDIIDEDVQEIFEKMKSKKR